MLYGIIIAKADFRIRVFMKADIENKLLAAIRVRGRVGVRQSISETLDRLNLRRVNNLSLLYGTKSNIGMIAKCSDFITYGEISQEVLENLLQKKEIKASKEDISAISSGKKKVSELARMPIRLHPPRHGYEAVKRSYANKGSLGYRGDKINDLIKRMA